MTLDPIYTKLFEHEESHFVHEWSNVMTLAFVIDGGGSPITTGIKGTVPLFFNCNIEAVTLLADVSGSCVIDIWKDTYGSYPPDASDSISNPKPTLASEIKYQDTTLTSWFTRITSGDALVFNVDSLSTITRLTCALRLRKI